MYLGHFLNYYKNKDLFLHVALAPSAGSNGCNRYGSNPILSRVIVIKGSIFQYIHIFNIKIFFLTKQKVPKLLYFKKIIKNILNITHKLL